MIVSKVQKISKLFCVIIIVSWTFCCARSSEKDSSNERPYSLPILRVVPQNVTSMDGILEFTCQANGVPNPLIFWYNASTGRLLADQVPTSGSPLGIHTNPYRGRLMISGAVPNTNYQVYCNASNTKGWVVSQPPVTGRLAFIGAKFGKSPVNQTVGQNGRLVLQCEPPNGSPEVRINWLFDGKVITNGSDLHNHTLSENVSSNKWMTKLGHLIVDPVTFSDSGIYVCVASNLAGKRKTSPAFVVVKTNLIFLKIPQPTRVKKNEDVKLWCQIDGDQVLKWSRALSEGIIDPNRSLITNQYILLKNVKLPDAGTYICSTPNEDVRYNATLTVDTPPKFVEIPWDLVTSAGSTVAMKCSVTGQPMPYVYWELPDMTTVFPSEFLSNGSSYPRVNSEGTIIIENVQVTDSGTYQCTAHSSVHTIHASARLTVKPIIIHAEERPALTSTDRTSGIKYALAPIINLPPSNETKMVGQTVDLSCKVDGISESIADKLHPVISKQNLTYLSIMTDKRVLIIWTKAGKSESKSGKSMMNLVDPKKYMIIQDGSLRITGLQQNDTGQYTCTAFALVPQLIEETGEFKIVLTQSSWSANLAVVNDPFMLRAWLMKMPTVLPPPRHLRITNITNDTVTLAWDLPDLTSESGIVALSLNARVSYWIEYFRQDRASEGWIVVDENWPMRIVHFHGLRPNIPYYFLIRSRWNNSFLGGASAPYGPVVVGQSEPWLALGTSSVRQLDIIEFVNTISLVLAKPIVLSASEVELAWSLSGHESMIHLIQGYVLSYKETAFSSCTGQQKSIQKNAHNYCSFNDKLLSHKMIARMKITTTVKTVTVKSASNSMIYNEVTAKHNSTVLANNLITHHKTKYKLQNLHPFRCYELTVSPIPHMSSHQILVNRVTTAQKILTYEDIPAGTPRRIAAQWINDNVFQLTWDYPPVRTWNGLLSGFIIYITSDEGGTQQRQPVEQQREQNTTTTVNVSSSQLKTVLKVSSHQKAYRIQMAAVNCIGLGPLSLLVYLPAMRHITVSAGSPSHSPSLAMSPADWHIQLLSTPGQNLTSPKRLPLGLKLPSPAYTFLHSPWFVAILLFGLTIWFIIILSMTLFCYHRQSIQKKTKASAALTPIAYYLKSDCNRKLDESQSDTLTTKDCMCLLDAHDKGQFRDVNVIAISPKSDLIINHDAPSTCVDSSICLKLNTETTTCGKTPRSAPLEPPTDLRSMEIQIDPVRTINNQSARLSSTEFLTSNLEVSDNYGNWNPSQTTGSRIKPFYILNSGVKVASTISFNNSAVTSVQPESFVCQPRTQLHSTSVNNRHCVSDYFLTRANYHGLINEYALHSTVPYATSIIDSGEFSNDCSQYPSTQAFTWEYSALPTEIMIRQDNSHPLDIRRFSKFEPNCTFQRIGENRTGLSEDERLYSQNCRISHHQPVYSNLKAMEVKANLHLQSLRRADISSHDESTTQSIRRFNSCHSGVEYPPAYRVQSNISQSYSTLTTATTTTATDMDHQSNIRYSDSLSDNPYSQMPRHVDTG